MAPRRYEAKWNAASDGGGKGADHAKGERFTIYGSDGQVLKSWTVDKDGEHETDGEQRLCPSSSEANVGLLIDACPTRPGWGRQLRSHSDHPVSRITARLLPGQ
jgi:hypothetical protein